MNHPKKALIISPGVPFPPVDGHKLKLYNLLIQLSKELEIHLIIISQEKLTLEAERYLKSVCKTYKLFSYSKLAFAVNLFKGLFDKQTPLQVNYYTFNSVKKYIKNYPAEFDFVILNLVRTAGYLDLFKPEKVILDLVDSIGINYLRSHKHSSSLFHRMVYKIETTRLIRFEKEIVNKTKLSLFVNKNEAQYYSNYGNAKWLPNGVNKKIFSANLTNDFYNNCVCFFGAMFYQPNIDAVNWFVANVLPKLNSNIKFYIIGQGPSKNVLRLQSDRIVVKGFMENPYEILKSCLCTVAPMQTGGGIQNKILESMALGQLTITNDLGATPITGAVNKVNLLVANKPDEFVELINDIYTGKVNYGYVGVNARTLIENNYSWDSYGKVFLEYLNN